MPTSAYPRFEGEVVVAPAPVVVMIEHSVEALAIVLGVLRQGFPLLPLSVSHTDRQQLSRRYAEAMELFEPVAIISDSPLALELLEFRPNAEVISPQALLNGGVTFSLPRLANEEGEDVPTTLDNVLAYVFTSGSTGKSKCVTVTNRMAWAEVQWYPQLFRELGVRADPRSDRWRNDHEMGWWGAAYFGEIDVALAMQVCIVMTKPNDADVVGRGVTMMGALPSQLQNLWPDAKNAPRTLRLLFSWAERCDVELGETWKKHSVTMADLLIASEFWLSLASRHMEVAQGDDGRAAHAMRPVGGAFVFVLDESLKRLDGASDEVTGLLAIGGPQVSPGYAERFGDGTTVIGAGELSKDVFKVVDGHRVVVPKDIVKKRLDQSFVSIGRGGGMVKVRGGVLMATNVVELELQKHAIAAACITDPVHTEGGGCVVLEMNWLDVWSLRDSLQQASFLRMPIVYTSKMPRNASTGKVQKALVQQCVAIEIEAEASAAEELRTTQRAQLSWYARIALPIVLAGAVQSRVLLCVWALWHRKGWLVARCLAGFLPEVVSGFVLVAWTYGAIAHSCNLGAVKSGAAPLLVAAAGALTGATWPSALAASGFVALVAGAGDASTTGPFSARFGFGRLGFSVGIALAARLFWFSGVTSHYALGLLVVFALNRCLPGAPHARGASFMLQRIATIAWSFLEASGYMLCLPIAFALAAPSLVLAEFPTFAWARFQLPGRPVAREQAGWSYMGNRQQLSRIKGNSTSDGSLSFDVSAGPWNDLEAPQQREVQAETFAGARAQALARQAGVDFSSVDSLRISRLSILIKKHLRPKSGEKPLEFNELREACADEQSFVSLIDLRMVAVETEETAEYTVERDTFLGNFMSWLRGGATIHREGATQAPWDCQVDVLLEWRGSVPLERQMLGAALGMVVQQQPMLRACLPPDDSTDALMGTGSCDFSTIAAATWALLTTVWSTRRHWTWRISRAVRWLVANALWRCWPRTLVMRPDERLKFDACMLSKESDGWTRNEADEVHSFLGQTWKTWWNPRSVFNVCVVTLETATKSKQFLYCSISHKYSDGGSAAAFVHSLSECYEALADAQPKMCREWRILPLQQQRLQRYLSGATCPEGSMDVYLFDIANDSFNHGFGQTLGAYFTESVCSAVRVVGLRVACSEEIAWLVCITCALCRLMPDAKFIKILMVHSGRSGEAAGAVGCLSQYVMLSIPCAGDRTNTPLADVASRVKFAVTHGRFRRPAPCEQSHAKINIGGMVGSDGGFSQVFKRHRCKKPGRSRAPHVVQLRMDKEGETWSVKDFKCHQMVDPQRFWEMVICASLEIADGWFTNPLAPG